MNRALRVLVTGGAGYVGSHAVVALLAAGHSVHVLDNLATGRVATLEAVRRIAGRSFGFTRADLRDRPAVAAAVGDADPEAVLHFAGLKVLGASAADPLGYYLNNVGGTLNLLAALAGSACRRVVFSSSAAVYGVPLHLPLTEDHPRGTANPYGRTKRQIEEILEDVAAADGAWSVALLRYFNPAGAHGSGAIGEDPRHAANNLMPRLVAAAAGRAPALTICGDDYGTPDGTGVRDYVHVEDVAAAHLAALDWTGRARGAMAFNLGTGRGTSVRELVAAFAAATGCAVPTEIGPRRPGDVPAAWADPGRAARVLGWRAERDLAAICASAWAHARGRMEAAPCGTAATLR